MQGLLFGALAGPGWAAVRCLTAPRTTLAAEVSAHPWLYGYLVVGAAAGFAVFGAVLGHHEDLLRDANRRLDALAVSDPLTGLKNVRYFRSRLEEARAAAARSGEPLSVIVLDLDRFKRVNDEHGHLAGDQVLTRVAGALAAGVRDSDTAARVEDRVARMGGEEFAVLLPGATEEDAFHIAARLLDAIRATPVQTAGAEVRVTASAGVATSVGGEASADELYARADEALYASKAAGRDRVTACGGESHARLLDPASEAWMAAAAVTAALAG
ncbi:MAG TPA: GGDEF domain-containing protein [Longimicrobiaceae bacterium]|nr:GGDEF domain-containing protein [Longimicrobiaceae bacterium]